MRLQCAFPISLCKSRSGRIYRMIFKKNFGFAAANTGKEKSRKPGHIFKNAMHGRLMNSQLSLIMRSFSCSDLRQ